MHQLPFKRKRLAVAKRAEERERKREEEKRERKAGEEQELVKLVVVARYGSLF